MSYASNIEMSVFQGEKNSIFQRKTLFCCSKQTGKTPYLSNLRLLAHVQCIPGDAIALGDQT